MRALRDCALAGFAAPNKLLNSRQNREDPGRTAGSARDFHRDAKDGSALGGQPVGVGEVLEGGMIRAEPKHVNWKLFRLAGVYAGGVDRDRYRLAVIQQELNGFGRKAGEVQIGGIV